MNILCSVNERFLKQYKCLIYSLAYTQTEHLNVYFINATLTDSQVNELKSYTEALDMTFIPFSAPEYVLNSLHSARDTHLDSLNRTFSIECFMRIFAHLILPESITRVLWLDCDCIVQKNLNTFYYSNLFDNLGLAVADGYEHHPDKSHIERIKGAIGLENDYLLFNSGVLLMNLKQMRLDPSFELNNLIQFIVDNPGINFDQDILNALGKGKYLVQYDMTYNYAPNWWYYEDILETMDKKAILHYYGQEKPWLEEIPRSVLMTIPWKRTEKMAGLWCKQLGIDF